MYPYKIFGFASLYGLCIIVGAIICIFVVLPLILKKYNISKKSIDFYQTLGLVAIALGFVGAWLFQLFYDLIDYGFKLPSDYWRGADGKFAGPGITFLGGLITGAATFLIGALLAKPEVKREFWIILRAFGSCVAIAHAFGRMGCFFAGCCYGMHTDGPLAMDMPHGHTDPVTDNYVPCYESVLPTQLIEAIFLFVLFAVCFLYTDKSMLIYLFSYGVFRFVLEFFRGDARAGDTSNFAALSPSQWISIAMFVGGFVLLYFDITKGMFKKYVPPAPPTDEQGELTINETAL